MKPFHGYLHDILIILTHSNVFWGNADNFFFTHLHHIMLHLNCIRYTFFSPMNCLLSQHIEIIDNLIIFLRIWEFLCPENIKKILSCYNLDVELPHMLT